MNSELIEPHASSPIGPTGGSSDTSYFYNSRHFQEVRAALRYGIEAHKGLILFTGEAGRGKTVLLHRIVRELEHVTFVVASDPEVSFSALLHLLARTLQIEIDATDRLSLLQSCKSALRSEMDRGGTVCLIIDNAERLRDDTLECVLQNFLGAGISTNRDRPLLQVILAGRPELGERMLQSKWRSMAPVPGLNCEVESLDRKESAEYIQHRLHAGHPSPLTLQSDAIDRIAAYAGGDLRLTNSLCSSVLALAARSSPPTISVDLANAAARELGLPLSRPAEGPPSKDQFEFAPEQDAPFTFQMGESDTTQVGNSGETFDYADESRHRLTRVDRHRGGMQTFLWTIFFAAAFLWLGDQLGLSPSEWSQKFKALYQSAQPARLAPGPAPSVPGANVGPAPAPAKETPAPILEQNLTESAPAETDNAPAPPPVVLPDKPAKQSLSEEPQSSTKHASLRPRKTRDSERNLEISDKQLEMEIYKAISNRAIMGVTVSVTNGTANLEGRVPTERQKRAAERAARSVEGIERVRNRILVG